MWGGLGVDTTFSRFKSGGNITRIANSRSDVNAPCYFFHSPEHRPWTSSVIYSLTAAITTAMAAAIGMALARNPVTLRTGRTRQKRNLTNEDDNGSNDDPNYHQ